MSYLRYSTAFLTLTTLTVLLGAAATAQVAVAQEPVTFFCQFTQNGQLIGTVNMQPTGANDKRWEFTGTPKIIFTKDFKTVGSADAPDGANDAHITWDPVTGRITNFVWTKDKIALPNPPAIPAGTNDYAIGGRGKLTNVAWTKDGTDLSAVPVPNGTDGDVCELSSQISIITAPEFPLGSIIFLVVATLPLLILVRRFLNAKHPM
jgi:hypothetical protein